MPAHRQMDQLGQDSSRVKTHASPECTLQSHCPFIGWQGWSRQVCSSCAASRGRRSLGNATQTTRRVRGLAAPVRRKIRAATRNYLHWVEFEDKAATILLPTRANRQWSAHTRLLCEGRWSAPRGDRRRALFVGNRRLAL